jgi:hypothetical protein
MRKESRQTNPVKISSPTLHRRYGTMKIKGVSWTQPDNVRHDEMGNISWIKNAPRRINQQEIAVIIEPRDQDEPHA